MDIFSRVTNRYDRRPRTDSGFSTTGVIFTLVIVVAVGAVAYLQWGESAGGSAPAVSDVVTAHESVESFQHDTTVSLTADLDSQALQERDDAAQLQGYLRYIPNVSGDEFPSTLTAEASITGNVSLASSSSAASRSSVAVSLGTDQVEEVLAVDWRKIDSTNYLRARTLPNIGMFPLDQYEGQWYAASSTGATAGLQSTSITQSVTDSLPSDTSVSPETARELVSAITSEGLIVVENTTRTELRSGAPAWQLDLRIDPSEVSDYQQAAKQIIAENNPDLADSSALSASSSRLQEFTSDLERLHNQLDQIRVWVARESHRIHRIKIESEVSESEIQEMENEQLAGVTNALFTIDIGLSAYNESVDVQAPEDAQPIQQAFGMMMGPASGMPSTNSLPITN